LPPPSRARSGGGLDLGRCSLQEFAAAVRSAAKSARDGRWHGAVFVNHVWNELQSDGASGLTYDRFKKRLFEAYQDELLDLSRADLVEAMPSDDVVESEITHHGARFHFVRP